MKKDVLDFVVEKTRELIDSPTCSSETRDAANTWLDSVGTEAETEETKKYIAELEEDIMPIDTLIGFAESEAGAQVFGADKAKDVAAHAREIKAEGAEYCDCPACSRYPGKERPALGEQPKIHNSNKTRICSITSAYPGFCVIQKLFSE